MDHMQSSVLVFNHAHIRTINIPKYKVAKEKRDHINFMRRFKKFITLWTPFAAISISAALLTPFHFV